MFSRLKNLWYLLKGNLWFRPAALCLFFFAFTLILFDIETRHLQNIDLPSFLFNGNSHDAKAMCIALLSAMITMATLAISITIVVLSLAASQLGPRLIKTFMGENKTKNYIGLFFGTVTSCFVLTMILHSRSGSAFPPSLTISFVFGLCLLNLFVLLGFVNHVAQSSIADNVTLKVSNELKNAIERLTSKTFETNKDKQHPEEDEANTFKNKLTTLDLDKSGYIQSINYSKLSELAAQYDVFLNILCKSGDYLLPQTPAIDIFVNSSNKKIQDKENEDQGNKLNTVLRECFIIGQVRTATLDIEYSIRHLVEIAIRALSPGINDSFTAMNVIDQLCAALSELFENDLLPQYFYDKNGVKRIKAKQTLHTELLFTAFEQIRFNAREIPSVQRHFARIFQSLAYQINDKNVKDALKKQIEALIHDLKIIKHYVTDKDQLIKQLDALAASL